MCHSNDFNAQFTVPQTIKYTFNVCKHDDTHLMSVTILMELKAQRMLITKYAVPLAIISYLKISE